MARTRTTAAIFIDSSGERSGGFTSFAVRPSTGGPKQALCPHGDGHRLDPVKVIELADVHLRPCSTRSGKSAQRQRDQPGGPSVAGETAGDSVRDLLGDREGWGWPIGPGAAM